MMHKMNRPNGGAKPHLKSISSKVKIAASVVGLLILLEGKLGYRFVYVS